MVGLLEALSNRLTSDGRYLFNKLEDSAKTIWQALECLVPGGTGFHAAQDMRETRGHTLDGIL